MANYFKEEASKLTEQELQFFANILITTIVEKKILTKEQVPMLLKVIEIMSKDQEKHIGQFCKFIIETLNYEKQSGRNQENQLG
jgi:hypothetical protein